MLLHKSLSKKGNGVLGLKLNHPELYKAVEVLILQEGGNDTNCLYDAFDESCGRSVRRRYSGYDVSKHEKMNGWSAAKTDIAVIQYILKITIQSIPLLQNGVTFIKS